MHLSGSMIFVFGVFQRIAAGFVTLAVKTSDFFLRTVEWGMKMIIIGVVISMWKVNANNHHNNQMWATMSAHTSCKFYFSTLIQIFLSLTLFRSKMQCNKDRKITNKN